MMYSAQYWQALEDNHLRCELCPRQCRIAPGEHGICFLRENNGGRLCLDIDAHHSGLAIDPIEKKPLYHFYPQEDILSFGTKGCNLVCRFCQNWQLSRNTNKAALIIEHLSPESILNFAQVHDLKHVAFTYNDPVIYTEFAIACAALLREHGISAVAITAAYISPPARADFFSAMTAHNVDLKGFRKEFYRDYVHGDLAVVLDNITFIRDKTDAWLEITNLIIPGVNDTETELVAMCSWIVAALGKDVPLHFSAFHPAYKMQGKVSTPKETLQMARSIALGEGLHYVYTGNVNDRQGQSTYCVDCGEVLICRDNYRTEKRYKEDGFCYACHAKLPGHFREGA
jgi:pyruvate formate lyase activating enzyme